MLFRRKSEKKLEPVPQPQPEESEKQKKTEPPKAPKKRYRYLRVATYWLTVMMIWLFVSFLGALGYFALTLPDPTVAGLNKRPPNVTVLADDGEIIANRGMRREHIRLEDMPVHLVNAVLAIEDSRFYSHLGIDPYGILRAIWENYRSGDIVQGGSTITQQLAKNLFFSPQQSITRKFKEGLTALWMEMRLSKKEILELYLNRVYFGSGAYGIEAAAYHYFGKTTKELSLGESALLAGLLKAPSKYSPSQNPRASRDRTRIVLKRMMQLDLVDKRKARNTIVNPVKLRRITVDNDYSYIADWIIERIPGFLGSNELDLVVETTINRNLQRHTQNAMRTVMGKEGRRKNAGEAAVVIMDNSGGVKALSGGLSHRNSPFNRAVRALRQPGSSFKPFVFLAALESGMSPGSMVLDAPVEVQGWRPKNYAGFYRGSITMRHALTRSVNTVAVRLFVHAGRERVIRTARRLGISSDIHQNPTIALGTSEVTLLELTGAYVPFSNGGMGILPYVIVRIKDINGKVLYERHGEGPGRIINYENVRAMNSMLHSVITNGTGKRAFFPGQAMAGKTGTSQDYRDAWFLGFTSYLTMGVWVGNDDNSAMRGVTGGDLPAIIWHDVMEKAHRGLPPKSLPGIY